MFNNYIWMERESVCILLAMRSHWGVIMIVCYRVCVVSAVVSNFLKFLFGFRQWDNHIWVHCSVAYILLGMHRKCINATCTNILKYTHNLMQDHTCRYTQIGIFFPPAYPSEGLHLCWTQLRGALNRLPGPAAAAAALFFNSLSLSLNVYVSVSD